MNPLVSLRRAHRTDYPSPRNAHRMMPRLLERGGARGKTDTHGKPSLSAQEYMAELNERLRRHPMYLEGMHFPDPQPGSTPMLAAALAWEGPWECLDVFSSVIEEVARDYDLALPPRIDFGPPPQPGRSA